MRRYARRPHTHACTRCQAAVPCTGTWERNYDGFPEAICTDYHLDNGTLARMLCEDCESAPPAPECPECGDELGRQHGAINEPVMRQDGSIGRETRPAVYWACETCEYCAESLPAA